MRIFVDTANLAEIEQALARGFVAGITTNPSILAKEERTDFAEHIHKILALVRRYGRDVPVSVEVFVEDPAEMLDQALKFVAEFEYRELAVKVPVGWDELKVIAELRRRDVRVNCTCCMTFNQAAIAAAAGANYVSLFWNRIRDAGADPRVVVSETAEALRRGGHHTEIIVGSIRHVHDVAEAFAAGAHIVTVPPKFLPQMTEHPKTTEAVQQFLADFRTWSGRIPSPGTTDPEGR